MRRPSRRAVRADSLRPIAQLFAFWIGCIDHMELIQGPHPETTPRAVSGVNGAMHTYRLQRGQAYELWPSKAVYLW